jgi:ligand-binding SRPBCC domain-containing protein
VFAFFSDAHNLNAITPPWLHFEILTPQPIAMRVGTRLRYRLRLRGVPLHWLTEITAWEPPQRFVDRQLEGPYRLWVHEHIFTERDGGALMRDRVDYAVPGGFLGPLLHRLFVGPDVARIFAYREERLVARFLGGAG